MIKLEDIQTGDLILLKGAWTLIGHSRKEYSLEVGDPILITSSTGVCSKLDSLYWDHQDRSGTGKIFNILIVKKEIHEEDIFLIQRDVDRFFNGFK